VAEAAGAVTERAVKTARLRNTPQQASPQAAPKTAPIVEDADAMGAAPAAEAAASEAAPQPEPQRGGKTQPRGPRRPGGLMGDVPPPLSKKEEKRQHQDQADYFWAQTKIAENVNLSDAARDEARRSAERTRQVVFGGGKVPRERKPRAPRKAKANEPSYASEIPDETGRMLSPDEARAELDMLQQQHAAAAPQRAEPTPRRELSPDAKPRGLGLLIGAMRHRERGDKEASARMLGDFGRTPYAQRERLEQQLEKAEGTAEKLREPARRRKGFRRPTPEEIEEQARHAAAIGEVKGEGTPTRGTPAPVAPTKLTPEEELALLERVANDPHIMPLRRKRAREDAEKMRKQLTKKQRRSKQ
jgi:hypothetical protein